jgi:hypothetical protein
LGGQREVLVRKGGEYRGEFHFGPPTIAVASISISRSGWSSSLMP